MAAMVDLLLAHGLTLSLSPPSAQPAAHGHQTAHANLPETTALSPPVHTLVLFPVRPSPLQGPLHLKRSSKV